MYPHNTTTLTIELAPPPLPPPPKPPPPDGSIPTLPCPLSCLLKGLTRPPSLTSITINLCADQSSDTLLATLPPIPSLTDSVTHVVCSPRVFGVHTDLTSLITICGDPSSPTQTVDSGSNVCVTGNLGGLLDIVDIEPTTISVVLEGAPASYDNCITKRGLIPLSLSDGTTYYQTCFYCANMVKTIISLAAFLASSDVFCSWTQEGFKDPALPGSLRFTSHDGLVSFTFPSIVERASTTATQMFTLLTATQSASYAIVPPYAAPI
jgi:hypothetical protein